MFLVSLYTKLTQRFVNSSYTELIQYASWHLIYRFYSNISWQHWCRIYLKYYLESSYTDFTQNILTVDLQSSPKLFLDHSEQDLTSIFIVSSYAKIYSIYLLATHKQNLAQIFIDRSYTEFSLIYFLDSIFTKYEGCSNMNASSFITFFIYMLRQNVIPFWKELFVAFKMAPNIKKHSLYFSSYRRLYKGHSCILEFFWSKLPNTFWYMCDIMSYLFKFETKWHQIVDASLRYIDKVSCRKKFI